MEYGGLEGHKMRNEVKWWYMVMKMEGRGRETKVEKEERKKERKKERKSDADKMDDNEQIYMLTTHKISKR